MFKNIRKVIVLLRFLSRTSKHHSSYMCKCNKLVINNKPHNCIYNKDFDNLAINFGYSGGSGRGCRV